MDQHLIQSLIAALAASDLSELEYTADGATLRLVKAAPGRGDAAVASPAATYTPPAHLAPAPLPEPLDDAVSAPAYGIVHLQRSPGEPPLVLLGYAVEAGQVLCVIEAMKVFTELRAGRAGIVRAILVESGQEVEVGQPLFRIGA